jgi:hypothetical protein
VQKALCRSTITFVGMFCQSSQLHTCTHKFCVTLLCTGVGYENSRVRCDYFGVRIRSHCSSCLINYGFSGGSELRAKIVFWVELRAWFFQNRVELRARFFCDRAELRARYSVDAARCARSHILRTIFFFFLPLNEPMSYTK